MRAEVDVDSALDAEHRRNAGTSPRAWSRSRKTGDKATVSLFTAEYQNNAAQARPHEHGGRELGDDARNAPAMAFIAVDFGDNKLSSGTGFNISPSGLIVTNRHVVRDENGQMAKRVAVKLDDVQPKRGVKMRPMSSRGSRWNFRYISRASGDTPARRPLALAPRWRL